MAKSGKIWTRRSTTVVFPVPEGADTTNSSPRDRCSLDILHLLPHLLELGLERDDNLGDPGPLRLRSQRVDLAVHFLEEEVQLAAARLGRVGERAPVLEVGAEPDGLLGDIR